MVIAFLFAAGSNLFAYWNSDKVVLSHVWRAAGGRRRARRTSSTSCSGWPASAELPMPKVYIVDNPQPNAFATGRNPEHAAVCVTTGLLRHVEQRRAGRRAGP